MQDGSVSTDRFMLEECRRRFRESGTFEFPECPECGYKSVHGYMGPKGRQKYECDKCGALWPRYSVTELGRWLLARLEG